MSPKVDERLCVSNHLCSVCHRVLRSLPELGSHSQSTAHYDDFDDIFAAAKLGCYVCSSLALAWENLDDPKPQRGYSTVSVCESEDTFWLYLYLLPDEIFISMINVVALNSDKAIVQPTAIAKLGSTLDEASLQVARTWLDDCLRLHKSCIAEGAQKSWTPTRLLKLDMATTSVCVRLMDCKEEQPSGPYVTLSHRWGTGEFMTLRTENLEQLKAEIRFSDLSKTFQDAVRVTLNLGYNYLWIDSLCILQDSNEDWLKEASLMQEVYQNALFTISATNPRSLDEGLSSIRHTDMVNLVVENVRFEATSSKTRNAQVFDTRLHKNLIERAPLNRRGWVLQERLLSRRILYFASSQLAWECDRVEACELFPTDIPSAMYPLLSERSPRAILKPVLECESIHANHERSSVWRNAWRNVVESYSTCHLTKSSDKLVALSGIAGYFKDKMNDKYLAGLWKDNLINELCWRSFNFGMNGRPTEYCAPSWSWASINGPVEFLLYLSKIQDYEPAAEVFNVETRLVDPNNAFGAVRAGSVTLKGMLTEVYWGISEIRRYSKAYISLNDDPIVAEELNLRGCIGSFTADVHHDVPRKVSCLVLRKRGDDNSLEAQGIIIQETSPCLSTVLLPKKFRRVGFFKIWREDAGFFLSRDREATVTIV